MIMLSGEDIWAYNNWFYNKANGTILESGALDGLKFSVSHFFEYFAGWHAIHIGTQLDKHFITNYIYIYIYIHITTDT